MRTLGANKHRPPSQICCALGLSPLGERCRGIREASGNAGSTSLRAWDCAWPRVWPARAPLRAGRESGLSPAVPYPSRGLAAYRRALMASERSREAGLGWDGGRGLQWNRPRAPLPRAALRKLALLCGRCSPGPLPSHLCAGRRAQESPNPITDPLRVSDFWPGPWRP